ncbi:hypothetical protein QUV58_09870, partial [Succinatimonas hippei]|uniref:hypothetical protein n=1 Tax=Succinatimonas hippei TaxID=626938 RepID=UPI0025A31587
KSGNAVPIVNLLTLMDQITHELYGVMSYSGDVTDVSTVESVCQQLMYQGDGGLKNKLRLICDRGYWSVFNLSTMLDHGCGFLVNCNTARSNKIKQLILEHAANLQGYNGTAIFRGDEPGGAVNGGALVRRSSRPLTAPTGFAIHLKKNCLRKKCVLFYSIF